MGYTSITYTQLDQISYSGINQAIIDYNYGDFKNFDDYKSYLESITEDEQCALYEYLDDYFDGQLGHFEFTDLIKDEEDINDLKEYFNDEV